MTFPVIQTSSSGTASSVAANTGTVTLPTGIAIGDYLVIIVQYVSITASNISATGWSGISSNDMGLLWRIADGTEGATVSISWSASAARQNFVAYRITGADNSQAPATSYGSPATGSTPASPSLTPSWGSADTLWMSLIAWNTAQTISAYVLTGNQVTVSNSGSANAHLGASTQGITTGTENPGNWTMSASTSSPIVTMTVGIKPAGGGFVSTGNMLMAF